MGFSNGGTAEDVRSRANLCDDDNVFGLGLGSVLDKPAHLREHSGPGLLRELE